MDYFLSICDRNDEEVLAGTDIGIRSLYCALLILCDGIIAPVELERLLVRELIIIPLTILPIHLDYY